jgi:hypothetical protein
VAAVHRSALFVHRFLHFIAGYPVSGDHWAGDSVIVSAAAARVVD